MLDLPDVDRQFLDLAGRVRQAVAYNFARDDRPARQLGEKELVRVRAVQFNVGEQQVNVTG